MTDEPPTPTSRRRSNAGTIEPATTKDATRTTKGKLHVVPAAVGAVAPLVNFPDGCDVEPAARVRRPPTGPDVDASRRRRPDPRAVHEAAVREGLGQGRRRPTPGARCSRPSPPTRDCNKPIIRVVRFDHRARRSPSRTTQHDRRRRGLAEHLDHRARNRNWPNATFGDDDAATRRHAEPSDRRPGAPARGRCQPTS